MPNREKGAAVLQQETIQDKTRGRLLKSVEEDLIGETISLSLPHLTRIH